MSYSATYEGGLNTITRVFDAGTTTGGRIVGIVPKDGKITRVRFHGSDAETDLTAQVFVRAPAGQPATQITPPTDLAAAFTSVAAAHAGVEANLINQLERDAKAYQSITVLLTTAAGSVGEVAVVVQFEPR